MSPSRPRLRSETWHEVKLKPSRSEAAKLSRFLRRVACSSPLPTSTRPYRNNMPGLQADDAREEERLKAALWYSTGQTVDAVAVSQNLNATPHFIGGLSEMCWAQIENIAQGPGGFREAWRAFNDQRERCGAARAPERRAERCTPGRGKDCEGEGCSMNSTAGTTSHCRSNPSRLRPPRFSSLSPESTRVSQPSNPFRIRAPPYSSSDSRAITGLLRWNE